MKKFNYTTKEHLVQLAGKCFWYWNGFYSFLQSCGVPRQVYSKYSSNNSSKYEAMRSILQELEDNGKIDIWQKIISEFYRMRKPIDEVPDEKRAIQLLKEFQEHVGKDPIEEEIKRREKEKKVSNYKNRIQSSTIKRQKLDKLKTSIFELISDNQKTPQKKGFDLEKYFFEILDLEEFEGITRPFRNKTEQIDGIFKLESFDYLVEIKFENGLIKKDALNIFNGKIRTKAQSTRGFMLAMNGFDMEHIREFMGHEPRIILMTASELIMILEGKKTFRDILARKAYELLKSGNVLYEIKH